MSRRVRFTQSGPRCPAVGLLVASGRERRAKARFRLYSAAAAFSQLQRHGTQIAYATLASGEVWIAVVVDGVVQAGGDMVLADVPSAREKLDSLIQRYGEVAVHWRRGRRHTALCAEPTDDPDQPAVVAAPRRLPALDGAAGLVGGNGHTSGAFDLGRGIVLVAVTAAREQARPHAMQDAVGAKAVWHRALTDWSHSVRIDGESGLDQVLNSIAMAPSILAAGS